MKLFNWKKKKELLDKNLPFYDMNVVDLSQVPADIEPSLGYMFEQHMIDYPTVLVKWRDEKGVLYLGHPDSVLLDNGKIITIYPTGHGRGAQIMKSSSDMGATWSEARNDLPQSFQVMQETPTIYKLDFINGDQKLLLASGIPGYWQGEKGNGFEVSLSQSHDENGKCDGKDWQEHENFFGTKAIRQEYKREMDWLCAVVCFSSFTRLKDNKGNWIDKWMGLFHDHQFNVYKTYLTFDSDGLTRFTVPTRILSPKDRDIEKKLHLCEAEIVRSPDGNELAMIFRTNAKQSYSQVSFSTDEAETWTRPKDLSIELTGERHKAEYDPVTGKMVVTFRSIDWKVGQEHVKTAWYSRGWMAWIGDYSDLKKGSEGKGDFVIKLAHTYLDGQTVPDAIANDDTGYAGLVIDDEGMIMTCTYGKFMPKRDTYVTAKRFKINDINKLLQK